jgi:hypothetical protein
VEGGMTLSSTARDLILAAVLVLLVLHVWGWIG